MDMRFLSGGMSLLPYVTMVKAVWPWLLPLVMVCSILVLVGKDRKKWAVKYRWWIAVGWTGWYALWCFVVIVSDSEGIDPWLWLSSATLRGLSGFGNVLWTPWFLLVVIVLAAYGRQVGGLFDRLAQYVKTVEMGGMKLSLSDPAPVTIGLTVGWWSDTPSETSDTADAVGTDGPIQEKPLGPYAIYEYCLSESERLLTNMTQQNHWEIGRQLRDLEWSWMGEYAEQLEQSVRLLRQAIRENRVQVYTFRYLAVGLPVRHMMLYMYGRLEHAAQFFEDSTAIDRDSMIYVLKQPITYWFLIYLCDRRQFDYARRLLSLSEFNEAELVHTRQALLSLLRLKTGRYHEAAGIAAVSLADVGHACSTVALPRMVLHYVAAMANLKAGMPWDAIIHAEAVRDDDSMTACGLRSYLQRHSTRLLVQARCQLGDYERIGRLVEVDHEAAVDPFVLNALAVARHNQGNERAAALFLRRAVDLLPPDGDEELRQTILENRSIIERVTTGTQP